MQHLARAAPCVQPKMWVKISLVGEAGPPSGGPGEGQPRFLVPQMSKLQASGFAGST